MYTKVVKDMLFKNIIIVTLKNEESNYLKNLDDTYNYIDANTIEELVEALVTYSEDITVIFSNDIDDSITDNIVLLKENVVGLKGINLIEYNSSNLFEESYKLEEIYDFEASELEIEGYYNQLEKEAYDNVNKATQKDDYTSLPFDSIDEDVEEIEEIYDGSETPKEKETFNKVVDTDYLTLNTDDEDDSESNEMGIERLNSRIIELETLLNKYEKETDNTLVLFDKLSTEKNELQEKYDNLLNEFNSDNFVKAETELTTDIKVKDRLILKLEDELNVIREDMSNKDIDIEAKKELIKEKNVVINDLKEEINEFKKHINDLTSNISTMKDTLISADKLSELGKVIEDKDLEISNLNSQVHLLKVDIKKEIDKTTFAEEELKQVQESYKELVNFSGKETGNVEYQEVNLSSGVKSNLFYFKVINQPPHFKSFIEGLFNLISKKKPTLMIIIRETDYYTPFYYPNIPIYTDLDEYKVDSGENVILLNPSKFMLTEDESLYNHFSNIIILDYTRTPNILLKGGNTLVFHTLLHEKERELLDINGMVITGSKNSALTLHYDEKFEKAVSTYLRRASIDKKIKTWLDGLGLRVY